MNEFNLRKYLKHNPLLKEGVDPFATEEDYAIEYEIDDYEIGDEVMVQPTLTSDPISKQGQIGIVKEVDFKNEVVYVMFDDGLVGEYAVGTVVFPGDESIETPNDEDEVWIDPAGGTHYGDEDDPADAYVQETKFKVSELKTRIKEIIKSTINEDQESEVKNKTRKALEDWYDKDSPFWIRKLVPPPSLFDIAKIANMKMPHVQHVLQTNNTAADAMKAMFKGIDEGFKDYLGYEERLVPEWPEIVQADDPDVIFSKTEEYDNGNAKYDIIHKRTGKVLEPGGRTFKYLNNLHMSAEDYIIPQGGTQSSQF